MSSDFIRQHNSFFNASLEISFPVLGKGRWNKFLKESVVYGVCKYLFFIDRLIVEGCTPISLAISASVIGAKGP